MFCCFWGKEGIYFGSPVGFVSWRDAWSSASNFSEGFLRCITLQQLELASESGQMEQFSEENLENFLS